MKGILEHRHSSLDRPFKESVLFEPESVLLFHGSLSNTEAIVTILNRSGETLEYVVKSNNKSSYKVKEPKGYLPPGKSTIYFIAMKKNANEEEMVTGDKFRIDVWKTAKPFDVYSKQYRVALKDDRGNIETGGMLNQNGFSTMVQSSGRTGTFASFTNRTNKITYGLPGVPKPKNKILLNEQREMEKLTTRIRVLQQQVTELRDQEALLEKRYFSILEDKQDKLVKWYLIIVILGFILGLVLRYLWHSKLQLKP